MFNHIIRFSLHNRLLVLAAAILLLIFGTYRGLNLPIDVLPDLNRPRVTIITECPGMAPEEVEIQVTTPLESVLNGAAGMDVHRSNSIVGLSIIVIEFDWNVDPYKSRQIISERLQLAAERLPPNVIPRMTPISSVMGQILTLTLWDDSGDVSPMELRTLADWTIRRKLQSIGGVSEVYVMGGDRKQFQVHVRAADLIKYDVNLEDVLKAVEESNRNVTGGYLNLGDNQILVRSIGRLRSIKDIENLVVKGNLDPPVLLKLVADVREAPAVKIGDGFALKKDVIENEKGEKTEEINGGKAVVITIEKQPEVDTRELTEKILSEMKSLETSLRASDYPGLRIECFYQQRTFIDLAIHNVREALWLGALLVVVVLVLFLMNIRATFITLLAMPLSIVITCLIFAKFGLSINTMTLGGLAVAIGELVDDAIVDVENIFRRLKENYTLEKPKSSLLVVFQASCEIRNSIVFGTIIVVLVFFPLFWLSGIEGKLFTPLGIAYVVSILASLLVSLTVTPVLAHLLLPGIAHKHKEHKGFVLRFVQSLAEQAIRFSLRFPKAVLGTTVVFVVLAAAAFFSLDRDFIPPFNEGAIQVNVDLMPGKSLEASFGQATRLSEQLIAVEGIQTLVCKTGRSEMDEHAVPVNTSEFICTLDRDSGRSLREVLDDVQKLIDGENNAGSIGFHDQPLQHLINHLRAGTKARIAVKLRGPDLKTLENRADTIRDLITDIDGIGGIRIDPIQVDIPQLRIRQNPEKLAIHGLQSNEVSRMIETAMNGTVATELIDGQRFFEVLVRFGEQDRDNVESLSHMTIPSESGRLVLLEEIAEVDPSAFGPSQIDHEAGNRQVVVQANPMKRGAVDVKEDIDKALEPHMGQLREGGYEIELAGLFQSEQEASRTIGALSALALFGIFLVLFTMFKSANLSLQIMAALPCALIGAVAAMLLTGQDRTIPNLVGMISLCGIASRNGILLMDHYFHLVREEGETWSKDMLVRAGRDRVAPVLMTALTSAIGLIPLTFSPDAPGREILYPIATVVIGGQITSTVLEFFVRPALFWTFGRKTAENICQNEGNRINPDEELL